MWFDVEKFKATYTTNLLHVNGSSSSLRTAYTKPLPFLAGRMSNRPSVQRKRHASESSDEGVAVEDLEVAEWWLKSKVNRLNMM